MIEIIKASLPHISFCPDIKVSLGDERAASQPVTKYL